MTKTTLVAATLLCSAFALEGCGGLVGLAIGAAGRAAGTGQSYAEWKPSAPQLDPQNGRLVVYVSGRMTSIMTVDWGTGGEFLFAVDRDVCDVVGASFAYVDEPVGQHTISVGDMPKFFSGYRKGKFSVDANVSAGKSTFVRIEPSRTAPDGSIAAPISVVPASVAEAELAALPLDNHFVSFKCKPNAAEDRTS